MEWDPGTPRIIGMKGDKVSQPDESFTFSPDAFSPLPRPGITIKPVLCELCQGVFPLRPREPEEAGRVNKLEPWHAELRDLYASSFKCDLCKLFMHALRLKGRLPKLRDLIRDGWDAHLHFKSERCGPVDVPGMMDIRCGTFWIKDGEGGVYDPESLVWCEDWNTEPFLTRPIWSYTLPLGFPESLQTVKKWLSWCNTSHSGCSSLALRSNISALPTRVIDVGSYLGSQNIHLLVSGTKRARYAALSHCWGSTVKYTTTLRTLKLRQQEINLLSLPKTFRDAILITQGLGIQYLWIDSLCIIQDDPDDWEQESSRMMSIYQGAHITIAATAASNGDIGCIFPRDPAMRLEFTPRDQATNGKQNKVGLMRFKASETRSLIKSPLNQRAWVLQEMFLSNRIVHFAEEQLFWQCRTCTVSEDLVFYSTATSSGKKACTPQLARTLDAYPRDFDALYNVWWDIVEDYSARLLTRKSDKWAGIAGVTQLFQEKLGDKPCAGLWYRDIHAGMAWTTKPRPFPLPPPIPGVPSWSWVSVDGAVQAAPVRGRGPKYSRIEDCGARKLLVYYPDAISWSGQDLTSQIANPDLTFNGRIARLAFGKAWSADRHDRLDASSYSLHRYPRPSDETDEESMSRIGTASFDAYPPDAQHAAQVWGFALFVSQNNWHGPAQELSFWRFHVLLLQLTGQRPGEYRRIGAGLVFKERTDIETWPMGQATII